MPPPPLKGGGKKSAQGREFKFYKEREGKKRKKRKRGRKENKKGKEEKIKDKGSKKLVKKFRLRHTLKNLLRGREFN